jgi:tetratricopeptide (TPR) repeat protein
VDPEVYDAYLKGTYHWQKMTPADLETAQRYFELALEKDPEYAPAHEGMAFVWAVREQMGQVPVEEAGPKSIAAALEAVRLDDNSAGAHFALAGARTWREWNWAEAWPEWRRSLELDPNRADAHAFFAHFLAIIGRPDEALQHSVKAVELDPHNAMLHGLHAVVLGCQRRYEDAAAAARAALELQPTEPMALGSLEYAAARLGRYQESLAATETWLDNAFGGPKLTAALEDGWQEGGYRPAMGRLADALAERSETSYVSPWAIAYYYAMAGDLNLSLDWLENAYELHDPSMPYLNCAPEPLHGEPRFQRLLRKMNLPMQPDQPLELPEGS